MKRFIQSPAFIIIIALVILNFLDGDFSDPMGWLIQKLILLPGIVIGLSFHEFAHGIVSYALGDPTPKLQGRLTINPAAHMDPFGFVALLFAGFGWGIPVQINPGYYKHRRRDELLVSLAGVVMNFIIAMIFALGLRFLFMQNPTWLMSSMGDIVTQILMSVVSINIVLMIFNLFPIPPLDGFGIITELFNLRKYDWYYKIYDKGFLILLALILLGVTDKVLGPAVSAVLGWIINSIIF
ncbi:site-2 protease family protein [Ihubacter sp. rT4E-8]|uniref:site-2 protease family protein n=1 Tax=Ihubacter sp. rT4E-8 TaxID=3242369 RepID=UPI003CF5EF05